MPAAMFACSRMRSPISLERRREQPKQEAELPANRSQSEEGATSSLAVGEDTLLMLRGVKSSSHALPLLELLGDSSSRSHELITAAASSRGPSTTEAQHDQCHVLQPFLAACRFRPLFFSLPR